MKKMKSIKYAALLYTGLMLWTPPCYSFFPWPTFDVAEVAATIKGYVTSTQSMMSTVQSTAAQAKQIIAIGDKISSVKKFFNPEELKKMADAKLARVNANKERLEALREKLADEVATVIPGDNNNGEEATNTNVADADENIEENFDDFNVDDSLTQNEETVTGVLKLDTAKNKRGFAPNGALADTGNVADVDESQQEETVQGVKEVIPSAADDIKANLSKKPTIKLPTTSRGFRKTSSNEYINGFEVSYAQFGSVYTGTNDEGRYLFPDIIAQKCEMNYDEVNEDAVKKCIKTWVECLNGGGEEGSVMDGLSCTKLFKRAKHEEATGDLTAALNNKEYANSFEADVADDLENKSGSLSSEREDLSFLGEVGKANQKILIRMLHSMSSKLIQEGIGAIEFVEPEYYEGE